MGDERRVRRVRVGVLLYNIHAAKTDLFVRLANALPSVQFKLFPVVHHPHVKSPLIEYRDTSAKGRIYSTSGGTDRPAEVGNASVNVTLIWSLLKYSDIIMLFGCQGFPALVSALVGGALRRRIVLVYQGARAEEELRRYWMIRVAKRLLMRQVDLFIAQTPPALENLRHVYRIPQDRIRYAPYESGVAEWMATLKSTVSCRGEVQRAVGLEPEGLLVLFVGWLIELKGPHILVEAIAQLRKKGIDVKAILVGEAPHGSTWHRTLTAQIEARGLAGSIRCTGRVQRTDIAKYYLSADIFVLPSMKDLWPKCVVEAVCAGLPVITTKAVGLAGHIVKDGVNGYLVAPGDVDELALAIERLRDPALREEMSEAGRELIERFTSQERETASYVSALQELHRE